MDLVFIGKTIDIVVIGGGIMNNFFIDLVRKDLKKMPPFFEKMPSVVEAELGEAGGLEGALQFLKGL